MSAEQPGFDGRLVRIGVVGAGYMGAIHARQLLLGEVRGATLSAICDREPSALGSFSTVPGFDSARRMYASGLIDAVLIATPHYAHTSLAILALEAGLHVLTEKPLAVHKADASKMLAAYQSRPDPNQLFAVMLNLRSEPRFLALREQIVGGTLGTVRRIHWTLTDCFRTEAYYRSRDWRGTWRGEGGGVLLNQSAHALDLWQWLFGMPARVHAFCGFGRYHEIEVEDQVTAYLEYENGTNGVFVASTAEAPGTNRLEVLGDWGKIVLEQNELVVMRNEASALEFVRHAPGPNQSPTARTERTTITLHENSRTAVLRNFVGAILHGETLLAPASEGLGSVELANALIYSGLCRRTVELPLDPALYAEELERLIRTS